MQNITRAGAAVAVAVLMATAVAGCDQSQPARRTADTGKIAEAITADQAAVVADFNARDPVKLAGHDTADFVGMNHGRANIVGAPADLAANQQAVAADPTAHVVVTAPVIEVAAGGDMAIYRATYVFSGQNPATRRPYSESGNYIAGYKPGADGVWKIAWSVISDTGPAAPAAKTPTVTRRPGRRGARPPR